MTREEAIEYWEGLRKTFSSQLEKEESYFGRMHLQTTIDAIDMAISALRQQDATDKDVGKNEPLTNAQKIRSMSDEELAGFLMKLMHNNIQCFGEGMFPYHPCPQEQNCKQCGIDWLQQPAEEDDHDERKENENVRR